MKNSNQKEKIQSLRDDLKKAMDRLHEALVLSRTDINRDATIQRFEFCFELAWKLLQTGVRYKGLEAYGPRDSIRLGAEMGLVENPDAWLAVLEARNLTTHMYDMALANLVYDQAKNLPPLLTKLLIRTKELL